MYRVTADDIKRLQSNAGLEFAVFVDALIWTELSLQNIQLSELLTCQNTTAPDGGVDTHVKVGLQNDPTGWLTVPSCWQYKASDASSFAPSQIPSEVKKPNSKDLIKNGFGYRVAICDSLSETMRRSRQKALEKAVHKINRNAPAPVIVTADHFARWANKYPAIVIRFFRPQIAKLCVPFDSWRSSMTADAPQYVPIAHRDSLITEILDHIRFDNKITSPVYSIQGQAGVGKTRLVLEALSSESISSNLIVYCNDEKRAEELVISIVNDPDQMAIIVADECGPASRLRMESLLKSSKDRVRVIAIDNSGIEPTGSTEVWINKLAIPDVEEILKVNFPDIPNRRRTTFAELSGGFLRIAIHLCNNDPGDSLDKSKNIWEILTASSRLSDDEQNTLLALSLFFKVGVFGDVADELKSLCELIGLDYANCKNIIEKISTTSGFIAKAGRYVYITPEILAREALLRAWRKWLAPDSDDFLKKVPQNLVDVFQTRIMRSGSDSARETVSSFFFDSTAKLSLPLLSDEKKTENFCKLVEIDPLKHLPTLESFISTASDSDLRQLGSGSRRQLVWLLSKLASFPEYFSFCESALFRLASSETDLGIGNNATGLWRQLYQIFLSGTAVSFFDRLKLLESKISSSPQLDLLFSCFDEIFISHFSRMGGRNVVAGRITPEDWMPKTRGEENQCYLDAVKLLSNFTTSTSVEVANRAKSKLVEHAEFLLEHGMKDQLAALNKESLTEAQLLSLINSIDRVLGLARSNENEPTEKFKTYLNKLQEFKNELVPNSTHGELLALVGKNAWDIIDENERKTWGNKIDALASQLVTNPSLLEQELEWIHSEQAKSGSVLAKRIGSHDADGRFFNLLLNQSIKQNFADLLSQYFLGLLYQDKKWLSKVSEALHKLEEQSPIVAFYVSLSVSNFINPVDIAERLIEKSLISVGLLKLYTFGGVVGDLSEDDFLRLIKLLRNENDKDIQQNAHIAIDLIAARLHLQRQDASRAIIENKDVRVICWDLLKVTLGKKYRGSYWWNDLMNQLIPFDPERAIEVATLGIVRGSFDQEKQCVAVLSKLSRDHGETVLKELDKQMFDPANFAIFFVHDFTNIFRNFPLESVRKWLETRGDEGAIKIARHLPEFYISEDGQPVVPELTKFVLEKFETNDRVFSEFCAGYNGYKMYHGDIAQEHENEAEFAKKFLTSPIKRVRDWAQRAIKVAKSMADISRIEDEERFLD